MGHAPQPPGDEQVCHFLLGRLPDEFNRGGQRFGRSDQVALRTNDVRDMNASLIAPRDRQGVIERRIRGWGKIRPDQDIPNAHSPDFLRDGWRSLLGWFHDSSCLPA